FFQAEDGIRRRNVTGVQTCALPIFLITAESFESMVDSSDSAVIRSDYLQDVKEDINETFETLQKQDEIISETIEDVSDISSATRSEERRVGKESRDRWLR